MQCMRSDIVQDMASKRQKSRANNNKS